MGAVKGKSLEVQVCPLCKQFSSKRITSLVKHFKDSHGKTDEEVWETINGEKPRCACGCGKETKWRGWLQGYSTVVVGHNASIYAVYTPEEAKLISEKRSKSLTGKTGWSKGLTKETDERVRLRGDATSVGRKKAFEDGKISPWAKGLVKETDDRVAACANSLKSKYESGDLVPWSKGLTKETDNRLAELSKKLSIAHSQKLLRDKLDSLKRLTEDEIRTRIESSGNLEFLGGTQNYVNDASQVLTVKCKKCGTITNGSFRKLSNGRCFKCAPGGSIAQEDIALYVESLGFEVKRNDRKTISLELDIYVPSKNFAIEYNGLYWHSITSKSSSYHANKTKLSNAAGVSLFHVFEDEWRDKRDIVKSMICARLGLSEKKIDARKCVVKELSIEERKMFFSLNHLDGDVRSDITYGLVFEGDIVYALSLRKPFHKKHEGAVEIARCCPAMNCNVRGGLSKLMTSVKNALKQSETKHVLTYVDSRFGGSGKGYEIAGMSKTGATVPRFWWTDTNNRFNRFKFRADADRGMTESAVAEEAGVVKIFGCENFIYEMEVT